LLNPPLLNPPLCELPRYGATSADEVPDAASQALRHRVGSGDATHTSEVLDEALQIPQHRARRHARTYTTQVLNGASEALRLLQTLRLLPESGDEDESSDDSLDMPQGPVSLSLRRMIRTARIREIQAMPTHVGPEQEEEEEKEEEEGPLWWRDMKRRVQKKRRAMERSRSKNVRVERAARQRGGASGTA